MDQLDESVRLYGLNPERVRYYRRVRDCLPYFDYEGARRKLTTLRAFAQQLDQQIQEFDRLTGELIDIQVGYAPTPVEFMFGQLQERPEGWLRPCRPIKYRTSAEEWTDRPTTPQGKDAWNQFLVALQQQPVRMYRTSVKRENKWEAEFKRQDGSPMFVSLSDLTGTSATPPLYEREQGKMEDPNNEKWPNEWSSIVGMCDAGSLVEIVDRMLEWLDKEEGVITPIQEPVAP